MRYVLFALSYLVHEVSANSFPAERTSDPGPSDVWVFIDHHEDSIDDPAFFVETATAGDPNGYPAAFESLPASRHGDFGVMSFADGHILFKKWQDPRTRQPVTGKFVPYLVSPGNPDVDWLSRHAMGVPLEQQQE